MAKGRPLDEHAISGLLGEQIRNSYVSLNQNLLSQEEKLIRIILVKHLVMK